MLYCQTDILVQCIERDGENIHRHTEIVCNLFQGYFWHRDQPCIQIDKPSLALQHEITGQRLVRKPQFFDKDFLPALGPFWEEQEDLLIAEAAVRFPPQKELAAVDGVSPCTVRSLTGLMHVGVAVAINQQAIPSAPSLRTSPVLG